ncbi:nucleopolyhedrovirus P10 family protein [Streptomyces alboflavus]|uniref:nucleopolyhedrovirus P10 family protein n=1 Tax=Streptomyces alboflavus TaxID=67267 RepID=UPI000F65630B|nr:nucleopolyhedrovirus P10 family protein [Streptomyces alboflavus]
MTGDGWTSAVRRQLGLGRMLPLGGPGDGAWLAESAARSVLCGSAARVAGVRVTRLRVSLVERGAAPLSPDAYVVAVPSPPSALPPGPLRISAEFQAATTEPLATAADRLRRALGSAAAERLGLVVTEVDLRVTGLMEGGGGLGGAVPGDAIPGSAALMGAVSEASTPGDGVPEDTVSEDAASAAAPSADAPSADAPSADAPSTDGDIADVPSGPLPGDEDEPGDEGRVARAALAVPGVTRMAGVLGGLARAVHIEEQGATLTLPRRHVRVDLAVDARHRTLDVARAVRAAVAASLPDRPSVAVLVTAVD